MDSVLRQRRGAKKALETLKEFDAFTKVPEDCVQQTRSGGTISLFSYVIMLCLIVSEMMDFLESRHYGFKFSPDDDTLDSKLKINIDMTVASHCDSIGLDVIDKTKEILPTFGHIQEDPVFFELTPPQRKAFDSMRNLNSYLSQEYHDMAEKALVSQYETLYHHPIVNTPSKREERNANGCHFHGTLETHKVAGVLHIIEGKSIPIPGLGHAHLNINFGGFGFGQLQATNFSHRIHRFSFGESAPGFVHPLDADEKIDLHGRMNYQYFIQIVPTEVVTLFRRVRTYQYSVTEQDRLIDHAQGSHGQPGIFIKWDLSGLKVVVSENHEDLTRFLTRLCALVGGVFATSGLVSTMVTALLDFVYNTSKRHCPLGIEALRIGNNKAKDSPSIAFDIGPGMDASHSALLTEQPPLVGPPHPSLNGLPVPPPTL